MKANSESGSATRASIAWAVASRARSASVSACQSATKPAGSASNARRRRTTSVRTAASRGAVTSTIMPKRSSSCGRRSPSSRFMVPSSVMRAGWRIVRPSRSTVLCPMADTSSSTSTRWSGSRLTSSIYNRPRCAAASRPGWNALRPSLSARSMSRWPSTRSSVAPSGRLMKGTGALACAAVPERQASHSASGASGAQLKAQPATRVMGGSTSVRPRAAVLLAVPLSPRISTPPRVGSIAHSSRARLSCSWPTMALNG